MSKIIKMRLSTKSIDKAIKEIKAYKDEVRLKTVQLVRALASIGLTVVDSNKFAEGDTDASNTNAYVEVEERGTTAIAHLYLAGMGEDVAFIEFGAGVYYNGSAGSSPNPFGQKLGLTIGSYGKGHGKENSWYYRDANKIFRVSFGTKAAMPLAKADEAIRDQFFDVARAIFR